LRHDVRKYIGSAKIAAAPERVSALVAPHAGYPFSGATLGYAYARIKGKRCRRVILVGVSHYHSFEGCSIIREGVFSTPLGDFPVDAVFASSLCECVTVASAEFHTREHCLEIHLPFLEAAVGVASIVPILLGKGPSPMGVLLAKQLAEKAGKDDLLIASTDLSHRLSEPQAHEMDGRTIETVMSQDWQKLARGIAARSCSMCGAAAVVVAMNYALFRGADAWLLLDYRTSAAASGDRTSVVGYASISMERRRQ